MSTSSPRSSAGRSKRTWKPNLRAILILTLVLALGGTALFVAQFVQTQGGSPKLLNQAEALVKEGKDDLALSYLNEFLRQNPRNVQAMNQKAEILSRSAQSSGHLLEAIRLGEQALRLAPDGPDAQAIRRRQVKLYLDYSRQPDVKEARYQTADVLAKELVERGAKDDADALRLWAQVKEALAYQGDVKALREAIDLYERARALEPDNVGGATRLAMLYRDKRNDPDQASKVLDDLLAASPKSSTVRLVRHAFQADAARDLESRGRREEAAKQFALAENELDQAVALAPKDPEVRLAAAEYQLRRGRPEVAHRHLDALPEAARKNLRFQTLLGLARLQENRPEEAIESWRNGLVLSSGTDADLTWQLAIVLLKLGRLNEAEPLVEQYRRLSGSEEPTGPVLFLNALLELKRNRPMEAIKLLDQAQRAQAKPGAPRAPQTQIEFTLGQCYEAIRNETMALDHYQRAIDNDPKLTSAWLARAQILQTRRPSEAETELRKALNSVGEDPSVLVALARLEYRKQIRRPSERRDWSELERLIARAVKVAPAAPGLALVQAEYLNAIGKTGDGLALLEQATQHRKNDPEVWLARAEQLTQQGQIDQALLVLDQAMAPEAAGDQASLRIARAKLKTLRGHGQEARQELVQDLDHLPPDQRPQVWRTLGDLYTAQRNNDEARRAYNQWAQLLPNDPLPRLFLLELALAKEDQTAAQEAIDAIKNIGGQQGLYWRVAQVQELLVTPAEESPESRTARLNRADTLIGEIRQESPQSWLADLLQGQVAEQRGKLEEAATAYELALRRDGGSAALQRLIRVDAQLHRTADLERLRRQYGAEIPNLDRALAEAALQSGDKDKAAELARQVVEGNPASLDDRVWQARVLNALGQAEQAESTLRDLIQKQPDQLGPRLALLFFLANRKETEKAAQTIEQIQKNVKDIDRPEFLWAQCWRIAGDRPKADAAYEAALKQWPDDPRVVRGSADYYEATGQIAKAEACLQAVLDRDRSQRWAARALALLLSAHAGDASAWLKAWNLVGGGTGGSAADLPEDRLARGIVLARGPEERNRQQAKQILASLVADLPADYPSAGAARSILTRLYLQNNEADKAVEVAGIDAQARTATPTAIQLYAETLLAAKQFDKAASQIDRLEAGTTTDDLSVPLLRARQLHGQGKTNEAVALLQKVFQAHESKEDGQLVGRRIVSALIEIDAEAAETVANLMAELWPETSWVLATVLAHQGKQEEALKAYRSTVIASKPEAIRELARNTLALATSGKPDPNRLATAETVIEAALDREPEANDLIIMKGYLRHFQQRYQEEVDLYLKALQNKPSDFTFLNNLAWTLCEGLKKPNDALKWVNEAFERTGQSYPQFHDTRGVIYTRLGDLDKAIQDLETAVLGRPTGTVLAHLARAYHKAGRLDDFRRTRDRAREAGLTPDQLEPTDRDELAPLLFESGETAKTKTP